MSTPAGSRPKTSDVPCKSRAAEGVEDGIVGMLAQQRSLHHQGKIARQASRLRLVDRAVEPIGEQRHRRVERGVSAAHGLELVHQARRAPGPCAAREGGRAP